MILTIDHGPVRELRLDRPPVNALTGELILGLRQAIEDAPRQGVRGLILSGSPGRFSAGLDVPRMLRCDRTAMAELWRDLYALMRALACSSVPIAAAITGHAPAGGTVLPMFCDWRVMAAGEFKMGLNEVQVGIPLPPIILAALRRLVGARQAERLAVGGLLVSPLEALELGLIDEVVSLDRVVEQAQQWCESLLALPAEAMAKTRREARADLVAIFDRSLEAELDEVIASWWSPSTQETLRALGERLGKKK
ncbi:MAG: enoyl-CoA hydratase/isomerase family protein [Terriglobales bacterium]